MHRAAQNGHTETALALIAAKADVNITDKVSDLCVSGELEENTCYYHSTI